MSFTATLTALKNQLATDTALQAFANAKWAKNVSVDNIFRNRTEIRTADLPKIMLTRPKISRHELSTVTDGHHTVRLYCGFHQYDRTLAADEMIEFEELIFNSIRSDETLAGTALNVTPEESANDEGIFQPVYFMVMEIDVHHRQY